MLLIQVDFSVSFGEICLLSNTMEVDWTRIVVLKAPKNIHIESTPAMSPSMNEEFLLQGDTVNGGGLVELYL